MAQGNVALDNKTTEFEDIIINKDEFEDTEKMKDEDVVMEKDNLGQLPVQQCLKSLGYKLFSA